MVYRLYVNKITSTPEDGCQELLMIHSEARMDIVGGECQGSIEIYVKVVIRQTRRQ
jgi:hypothetical protein